MLSSLLLPLLMGMQAAPVPTPPTQIYTNEEQVYFEREAGQVPPPWFGLQVQQIEGQDVVQQVDEFGSLHSPAMPLASEIITNDQGFEMTENGQPIIMRRARPFTCWVSVRRHADRANGEADWSFDRALPIHDQGGRVLVSPEGAPPVVIRMRNVVWPAPSTNRPSLVLYVHRPESPDRAESYSWADPDARMVGINLRWMQASCSRV